MNAEQGAAEVVRLYFKGHTVEWAIKQVKSNMNTFERAELDKELKKIKEELK